MKKAFLLLCALLLVLGSALPLAGYRLARAVLSRRAAVPPAPASSTYAVSEAAPAAFEGDADVFLIEDLSTGEVQQVPKRDYLIGVAAAEMPLTWPDEALKAQIVAAHSYALYCRDHASAANGSWLSADPARRQGYLTDTVLHSYWGTDYEANYARLSALVDAVLSDVLCYDGAAAGTKLFCHLQWPYRGQRERLGQRPPLPRPGGQQHRPLRRQLRSYPHPFCPAGTAASFLGTGHRRRLCRAGTLVR